MRSRWSTIFARSAYILLLVRVLSRTIALVRNRAKSLNHAAERTCERVDERTNEAPNSTLSRLISRMCVRSCSTMTTMTTNGAYGGDDGTGRARETYLLINLACPCSVLVVVVIGSGVVVVASYEMQFTQFTAAEIRVVQRKLALAQCCHRPREPGSARRRRRRW